MTAWLSKPYQRWGLVAVGLAILAAISPPIVGPMTDRIRFSLMPDRERDESSGIVRLFRSFQMSLADTCYAKSTHYQHRGILYQKIDENILDEKISEEQDRFAGTETTTSPAAVTPKRDDQHEQPVAGEEHKDEARATDEHGHVHRGITFIPTAENDFRGIIGDVEREVKPFDTSHVEHTEPIEALPWLRLATWINPEHENAWVATAFWLKGTTRQNPDATTRAIALLERALALNPPRKGQPYEKQGLVFMLGQIYLFTAKNPRRAFSVLEVAIKRGEEDFAQLDEVQRDWLSYNFRNAALACRQLGQHEKAIEICKRGIALFPDDRPLQTHLRREQQLLKKARETKSANSKQPSRP
jgi:tetratricopeptide (TPR) repeat protein